MTNINFHIKRIFLKNRKIRKYKTINLLKVIPFRKLQAIWKQIRYLSVDLKKLENWPKVTVDFESPPQEVMSSVNVINRIIFFITVFL